MLEALFGKTVGYLGYSLSILALVLALVLTGHFSFWTIREISPESMKNWLGKLAKSTGRKAGSIKPARWVFVLLVLPLPILVFFFSRMSITGLVWAEALVFTILLLSIFPRMTERDGKPPRSNTAIFFVPMVVAIIATTLIHIDVVKWILAIIVGSVLLWFLIRRLKGKVSLEKIPGKEYAPDTAMIVLSCLGLISLNLIGYFGTSVQPRYWNWYYSDKQFFWVFNLGLLFVCILTSYRNEKSEIKPFAKSLRRFVMVATIVILAFNIYWRPLPGFTEPRAGTANSPTYRPIAASLDDQLTEYGNCESPGEPGGKQWQDEEKKIPVKGKKDPDDTGALQINTRIHADLIKETGIDPAKSKEDNYRLGKVILERYLANPSAYKEHPWEASRYCWEPVLAGMTSLGPTRIPVVLHVEAPVNEFGREVNIPRNGGNHSLDGGGKKYVVLWNDTVEEKLPREEDSKKPKEVYKFRLKSREKEPVKVLVIFF